MCNNCIMSSLQDVTYTYLMLLLLCYIVAAYLARVTQIYAPYNDFISMSTTKTMQHAVLDCFMVGCFEPFCGHNFATLLLKHC